MKQQIIVISAVLMLFLLSPAIDGIEKASAQDGTKSMDAMWSELNAAEKSLLAGNQLLCMGWLEYIGRPYGLKDLPEALASFDEATEYRDRYQRGWPGVDWKGDNSERYMMFEALAERSTFRFENRDLTYASEVWMELTQQAKWCEERPGQLSVE